MNPHLALLLSPVYEGGLAPAHRADLRASGLTEPTIRAQGIRSVPPAMIHPLLGFDSPRIGSALLFPFPSPAGGWMPHVRMKIFPALTDKAGHTIKYLQPKRSAPRLYFCRAMLEVVQDGRPPLYLIEGEKKALAASQFDLAAVGFCGIHGWHARGSRHLLPDFDQIPLAGRAVELVPDGDVQTNPEVERAVTEFAEALERRGARVRVVLLPVAA